jgi:hypothetical protein
MKKFFVGLLAAVLTLSLGIGSAIYVKHRARAKRCAESTYFPARVFGDTSRKAEFLSKYLTALQEPTFTCLDDDTEVYRLLYLPAFDYPTSIRVWRNGEQRMMTIKQLEADWFPGEGTPTVRLNTTRPMTPAEWDHFKALLTTANFWSMTPDSQEIGLDGLSNTLEGRRQGQYHVAYRWGPNEEKFVDACSYLLQLAKLEWKHSFQW